MPRVAVQIALYRSSRDLPTVLASLKEQTFKDWGLYLYENSCDAAEVEKEKRLLDENGIPYQWIIGATNTGFSAHNHLLKLHEAEFVFVLNDDAYLDSRCLEALVRRMDAEPTCAAATGIVYRWTVPSSERQVLNDDTVVDTAGLEYRSLANVVDVCAGQSRVVCGERINAPRALFGVSGAVALYRRSAYLDVSPEGCLYDPSFFMYKEDTELALRLLRKGYTSWFEPEAISFHRRAIKEESRSRFDRIREERRRPAHLRVQMYRNQWMIYVYHASFSLGMKDLVKSFFHETARAMLVFVASPRVFCIAWLKILGDLSSAVRRRHMLRERGLKSISIL